MHKQYHLFMIILALSGLICLLLCSAAVAASGAGGVGDWQCRVSGRAAVQSGK